MNQAHIHLLVNHVPILGSLFAAVLLGVGLLRQNGSLTKAGLVAVLAAGILCLPAQLTGEGAAAIVQNMPRVSRALIHNHAEAAELGFWVLEGAATLALLSLLMLKHQSPKARLLALLTLVAAIVSFGLLARAGNLGGQIRHTEIREGFGTADEL
jgi:multidrug transporter EmrE-like cation transporter